MSLTLKQALQMLSEPKWLMSQDVSWTIDNDKKANLAWKIAFRTRTAETLPRGVWFRIQHWQDKPKVATFQLECEQPNTRERFTIYRLELNPFGIHVNSNHGPSHLNGLFIDAGVTHEHSYGHYLGMDNEMVLPKFTPLAAVTRNPPQDFDSALVLACAKTHIMNQGDIPAAPLQQTLGL